MPRIVIEWEWPEAFDKFGFGDGDSWNGTHEVEWAIESLGYTCETDNWGVHNYMIVDILKDGESILFNKDNKDILAQDDWRPEVLQRIKDRGAPDWAPEALGYEDPLRYLPTDIIEHLDKIFDYEWEQGYYE